MFFIVVDHGIQIVNEFLVKINKINLNIKFTPDIQKGWGITISGYRTNKKHG